MNKRKYYIFALVMLFLVSLPVVNAANVDSVSLTSGAGSACDRYKGCWPNLTGSSKALRGMRVTLMYTSGTPFPGAKVINSMVNWSDINYLTNNWGYYYFGNYNKVQYGMMGSKPTPILKSGSGSPFSIVSADALNSYFHENGFGSNVVSSKLDSWNLDQIWSSLEGNIAADKSEKFINFIATMFSVDKGLIQKDYADLWILVEPVTYIRYHNKDYFGTFYELASLGYGPGVGVGYRGSNLITVIGRNLPCAAMVTGTIATTNPDAPGVKNGSYFNGNLNYVNLSANASLAPGSSISTICSGTKNSNSLLFSEDYVNTANSGIGISIVWVGKYINSLTCKDVETALPSLKGATLEQINTWPDKISFTKDGKATSVTKQWYIDECTCYGLYDTYKEKNNVYLPDLTKLNVQNIFNNNIGFFTSLKQQLTNKYKDDKDAGSVTLWTWDKYQELNCKYNNTDCTTVDFKKLDTSWKNCGEWIRKKVYDWLGFFWHYEWRYYENYYCDQNKENERAQKAQGCRNLLLYTDAGFTQNYINSHASQLNTCFEAYYQQFGGTKWTIDTYQKNGCTQDANKIPPKYDCTPQYNTGDCIDKENTYYIDSASGMTEKEYWDNCVFNPNEDEKIYNIPVNKTTADGANTYYDKNITSQYCPVYCTETMNASFDASTIQVYAGQYFVWNNHTTSGSRTCKTKEILYDKFTKDLINSNNHIEQSYNTYLVARDQQASVYTYENVDACSECVSWHESCHTDKDGNESCHDVCDERRYWDETCIGWESAQYGNGPTYASGSAGTQCSCSGYPSADRFNRDSKYSYWDGIKNNSNVLYDDMRQCHDMDKDKSWTNWLYKVDPKASVTYTDGYYSYTNDLKVSTSYTNITQDTDCQNVSGGIEVLTRCSGNICTREDLAMLKCSYVNMKKGATSNYDLPENIFRYVDKATHIAMHEVLGENALGITNNYIDIGYSNFPVAYGTKDGLYGEAHGQGKLSLEYHNLGYKLGNNTTSVDNIMTVINADYTQWKCEFKVDSELIPDPDNKCDGNNPTCPNSKGDITVIYRPIDLHNPFPDIDSKGRNTGSNWCGSGYNCSNSPKLNSTIQDVVTNNRGVTEEQLYYEEPMYTFLLTPNALKEIRKYNKNKDNSYASYTGSLDGKTYDFKCDAGTARNCKSEYLWYVINNLIPAKTGKSVTGTCAVEQNYNINNNNSQAFEKCRAINNTFYLAK